MAGNRIGIQVQVEFPSVTELKTDLARKWAKVKESFDAKINISADESSLKSVKARIKKVLKEDDYEVEIKTDISSALTNISRVNKEIKKVDALLQKTRNVKIKFDLEDMNRPLKDILQDVKKVDTAFVQGTESLKKTNTEVSKLSANYSKLQRTMKMNKDGSTSNIVKITRDSKLGRSTTDTIKDGKKTSNTVTDNRLKALKEVETVLKRIHAIEAEQIGSSVKHARLLEKEKDIQQEQLFLLSSVYKEKYKSNSLDEESIKALMRNSAMSQQIKADTIATNKQKKEMAKAESKIANAVSRVASLENAKWAISKKMVTAKDAELDSLKRQYTILDGNQRKLYEQYNLTLRMTDAQMEEIAHLKVIGRLEVDRLNDKKRQVAEEKRLSDEQKALVERQKNAHRELSASLKAIRGFKLGILELERRSLASGQALTREEMNQLEVMRLHLSLEQRTLASANLVYRQEGLITAEMKQQLALEAKIAERQFKRASDTAKLKGSQDKVNNALKEHESIGQRIGQLQRDLIFAGIREESVIEAQIRRYREKQQIIERSLVAENRMTAEMQQQIDRVRAQQREQLELNRLRQNGRDRDREYNGSMGGVNPMTVYSNARQASTVILESVARIDEAMTGIAKVADATPLQFDNFAKSSYDTANDLGVTADQYMLAVEKWVTAGKTFEESQRLGQIALTGAFVGNIEPDVMVKYMSVPFEAFRREGLEANDIINVMNETANNHAIEMDELGKAYVRGALSAKNAGVTFEEYTAMVTGAQESTRKGGESIGTGMKAMAINTGMIFGQSTVGYGKKYDFFKSIGVDFGDAEGQMKSMTQIMGELSGVWDSLADEDKSLATFNLAGKYHAETMNAIIDQWDDAVADSLVDAKGERGRGELGSAYIEHAKQADSVKFKLAELKNAWDELMFGVSDGRNGVTKVIDALVNGIEQLSKLVQDESFMTAMKFILGGIGLSAMSNASRRGMDLLGSGMGRTMNDARMVRSDYRRLTGRTTIVPPIINNGGDRRSRRDRNNPPIPPIINGGNRADRRRARRNGGNPPPIPPPDTRVLNTALSKGKLLLSLLGKVARFLPVIGQALFIADIAGVPVFEWIGNGYKKLTKEVKDYNKELQDDIKKTFASNALTNGAYNKNTKSAGKLDQSLTNKIGKKDFLTASEFENFKDEFNVLADEIGLKDEFGVDIRIEMNSMVDIREKLGLLNADLEEVKKNSIIDLSGGVKENEGTAIELKNLDNAIKLKKKKNEEDIKEHQRLINVVRNRQREPDYKPSRIDDGVIERNQEGINKLKEKNKALDLESRDINISIEKAMSNQSEYAQVMFNLFSKEGPTAFESVESEALISSLSAISDAYEEIKDKKLELNEVKILFDDAQIINDDGYRKIVELFPEFSKYSLETVNKNEEVRTAIMEVIDAEKVRLAQAQATAEGTVTAIGEQIGKAYEFDEVNGKIIEGVQALKGELRDDTLPKDYLGLGLSLDTVGGKANDLLITNELVKAGIINQFGEIIGKVSDAGTEVDGLRTKIEKLPEKKTFTMMIEENIVQKTAKKIVGNGNNKTTGFINEWFLNKSMSTTEPSNGPATQQGQDSTSSFSVSSGASPSVSQPTTVPSVYGIQDSTTDMAISSSQSSSAKSRAVAKKSKDKKDAKAKKEKEKKASTKKAKEKKPTKTEIKEATAKVSEDIWRYWASDSRLSKNSRTIDDLTRAMKDASEDNAQMIKLYLEHNKLLRSQVTQYGTISSQKNSELSSVLSKLNKYGFKNDGKEITNLGISKNFVGEKATKVEELLNSWKSILGEIYDISGKIKDTNQEMKDNDASIKERKLDTELKALDKYTKQTDKMMKAVASGNALSATRMSFVGEEDKELKLLETENSMIKASNATNMLMTQYNKLSLTKTKTKEAGELLEGQMDTLSTEILSQVDSIIAYKQSLEDLRIDRIISDMDKFSKSIDTNTDRISNNITNLQEGLLSGTKLSDLQSSMMTQLSLERSNTMSQEQNLRIQLEEELQKSLEAFSKKHVERQVDTSNKQLAIASDMYKQFLVMERQYLAGDAVSYEKVKVDFGELVDIGKIDEDYTFVKDLDMFFSKVNSEQQALTDKFNSDMQKSMTPESKDYLIDTYILDSLKNQEDYYKATISANNSAIESLKNELSKTDLSADNRSKIKTQIMEYEQGIISAQNSIKDTVKQRFEYEFQMLDKSIEKYDKLADKLQYAQSILESIGGANYPKIAVVLDKMLNVEKSRNRELESNISKLSNQMSLYQQGSYEWNVINGELEKYKDSLRDSNLELIDMNKNILSNGFSSSKYNIDKLLFGSTLDEFERQKELWMTGLERDFALEDTYKRLAELGSKIHSDKMDQLAKQEKLSRFEMSFLNKQLDILELEKKIENMNKEKNLQVLKKDKDGIWDWAYEAELTDLDSLKEELKDAKLELEESKDSAKKDYASQLESILANAEDGSFDENQLIIAIQELNKAYGTIISDIPQLQNEYGDIIRTYMTYLQELKAIASKPIDYSDGTSGSGQYAGLSQELSGLFTSLGKTISDALRDAMSGANVPNSATTKSYSKSSSLDNGTENIFHIDKLEFPNATDKESIEEALKSLPRVAVQYSKNKK